ncbi:uncharacterized protein LOC111138388 isoform X2 [Crassostrea virginica]
MAEGETNVNDGTRGRRRRRSSTVDSVYGSDYKRRKSSPASSSRSFISDPGSGRTATESVSYWMIERAESLGIFYAKESTDIAEFYKISKKCPVDEWFVYPFTGKNKHILDSLAMFAKEKLKRTSEFNRPLTLFQTIKQDLQYAGELKRCEEILNEIENSEIDKSDQQLNCYIPEKRALEINGVPTASIPDLRIIARRQDTTSLVAVVEVKVMTLKERKSHDKFRIQEVINDRVLGQLAGELLLDKGASVFGRVVLGILCMQTSMIFTYMEISDAHMQRIVEVGEVEDRLALVKEGRGSQSRAKMEDEHTVTNEEREGRDSDSNTEREDWNSSCESESDNSAESSGIIHYTKPYDYMNAEDREEIIEFLIWLGLQSLPGKHRL